jgi:hypothetical protein
MQKPPHRVGKRFWDRFVMEPERKVKKPAGLQTRQGSDKGFVVGPKLENTTFTKMTEMFDCCLSGQ